MSRGATAKMVRERKERHPEDYCPVSRCLWRTGGGRCPKHSASLAVELADMEARDPKLRELGERIENFGRAIAEKLRPPCTTGCSPECTTCHRRKAPVGRSVAPAMAGGLCDFECAGYYRDPKPCDLWPGEVRRETPAE